MSGRAVMVEKLLIGLRKLQDAHAYCDVDNSVKKMIEELPTFLPLVPLSDEVRDKARKEFYEKGDVELARSDGGDPDYAERRQAIISAERVGFNYALQALATVAGVGPICNLNDCKYFRQHAAAGRTNV